MKIAELTGPIMLLGFEDDGRTAVLERDGYSYVADVYSVQSQSSDFYANHVVSLTDRDGETFPVIDARHR